MFKLICEFVNKSCAVKNIPILMGTIYKKNFNL
jgi:hypothetical protein